jgi:hypothetical protein
MQEFVVPKSIPRTFAIISVAPFVPSLSASRMPPGYPTWNIPSFQGFSSRFRCIFPPETPAACGINTRP